MTRTILVLVTFLMLSAVALTGALAQQPGDTVTFFLPALGNQPEPPQGPHDKLVYSGGQLTLIDATGCEGGSFPMQNAVLVDPAGGRSGRIIGVITVSPDAVPPGTRLKDVVAALPLLCTTTSGVTYRKYQGTVE